MCLVVASCTTIPEIPPAELLDPLYLQVYNKELNQEFEVYKWFGSLPAEANRIGFFGPYALPGNAPNEGIQQLAALSKSAIHDHLVCLAFFHDEEVVAFSDVPRWYLSFVYEEEAGENIFHKDSVRLTIEQSDRPILLKVEKKYP